MNLLRVWLHKEGGEGGVGEGHAGGQGEGEQKWECEQKGEGTERLWSSVYNLVVSYHT